MSLLDIIVFLLEYICMQNTSSIFHVLMETLQHILMRFLQCLIQIYYSIFYSSLFS